MKANFPTAATSNMDPWKDPLIRNRILFIGGLHIHTTEDELYQFLLRFGEVMWFKIQKDQLTGAPKGFAFALFHEQSAYDKILEFPQYQIRGFDVEVRTWKDQTSYITEKELIMQRKVFVKDLLDKTSEHQLVSYFSRFGRVAKAEILRNHHDRTSRRIAFITFSSEEEARRCLLTNVHLLPGGHQITCLKCKTKKAVHENFGASSHLQSSHKRLSCSNKLYSCYEANEVTLTQPVAPQFLPLAPAYAEQIINVEPPVRSRETVQTILLSANCLEIEDKKHKKAFNPSKHFTTEDVEPRVAFAPSFADVSILEKAAEADTTLPGLCDLTLELTKKTKEVYIQFYAFPDLF